mmetsp:Transcript_68335/g.222215  ORF Transcript_68335/g.222215 Transcript_68335/m.222215 type:complete len:248 (+) Transcript_68335:1048-1791(+)
MHHTSLRSANLHQQHVHSCTFIALGMQRDEVGHHVRSSLLEQQPGRVCGNAAQEAGKQLGQQPRHQRVQSPQRIPDVVDAGHQRLRGRPPALDQLGDALAKRFHSGADKVVQLLPGVAPLSGLRGVSPHALLDFAEAINGIHQLKHIGVGSEVTSPAHRCLGITPGLLDEAPPEACPLRCSSPNEEVAQDPSRLVAKVQQRQRAVHGVFGRELRGAQSRIQGTADATHLELDVFEHSSECVDLLVLP